MGDGTILVTGSCGLIGAATMARLTSDGMATLGVDIRAPDGPNRVDICRAEQLAPFIDGAVGIVHLAAVARVGEAEQDPERCRAVNVEATRTLLDAALRAPARPWVLFASSREIYGDQDVLPVSEDAVPSPKNTYARSKLAAENLVESARGRGLQTATLRFANVYGGTNDHGDRVVPAFASIAAHGGTMRVDEPDQTLDFTHVADAAHGISLAVQRLIDGDRDLPTLHLASGTGTTLLDLAHLARKFALRATAIEAGTPRDCTVKAFIGNPARARTVLGWQTSIPLDQGVGGLVKTFAGDSAPPYEAGHVAAL